MKKKNFKDKKLRDEVWEKTGWGKVASWYDQTIKKTASSQKELILPELLKFLPLEKVKDKRILDLGCGTGFFLKEYLKGEPEMALGIDLDAEVLELAEENLRNEMHFYNSVEEGKRKLDVLKADAADLKGVGANSFDFVFAIESLVNMKDLKSVAKEVGRVLEVGGKFICVVNHPAFRVPQSSDWHFNNVLGLQGRIVYKYKSSHEIKIDMNPSVRNKKDKVYTYTFHRSFEEYFNTFRSIGLHFNFMKEICSNKESGKGPKQKAENIARTEIPVFLFLEFVKR